ncbi:MAG: hypothetical protein AB7U23_13185 [Dehalococcoidia bacterium]
MATSFTARRAVPTDLAVGGRGVGDGSGELRAQIANHKAILDEAVTAVNAAEAAATALEAAAVQDSYQLNIARSPDAGVGGGFIVRQTCVVSAIKVVAIGGTPTSAGTYTLAVTGAGNNLLGSATFDLKTLSSGVVTTVPLTATTGHKSLAAGSVLGIEAVSNNADLSGHNALGISVEYTRTV